MVNLTSVVAVAPSAPSGRACCRGASAAWSSLVVSLSPASPLLAAAGPGKTGALASGTSVPTYSKRRLNVFRHSRKCKNLVS